MSSDQNKELNRKFYEAINRGDVDAIDDFVAPDFIDHESINAGFRADREGLKQFFTLMRKAFPDLHFEIQDIIAEGDRVVVRVMVTGTNTGEFMGMPVTGKKISVEEIDIIRVANGQSVEHWGVVDQVSMLRQLGFMPAPGEQAQ